MNKAVPVSRIRGKVGQIEEPPEYAGKWAFSIWISELGGGDVNEGAPDVGPLGPYDTESIAKEEMKRCAQVCCEVIEKEFTGKVSGMYVDMKSYVTRKCNKSYEN